MTSGHLDPSRCLIHWWWIRCSCGKTVNVRLQEYLNNTLHRTQFARETPARSKKPITDKISLPQCDM